jgi:hypothetical protein
LGIASDLNPSDFLLNFGVTDKDDDKFVWSLGPGEAVVEKKMKRKKNK